MNKSDIEIMIMILTMIIGITMLVLIGIFYGWKLSLFIFIAQWMANIQINFKYKKVSNK